MGDCDKAIIKFGNWYISPEEDCYVVGNKLVTKERKKTGEKYTDVGGRTFYITSIEGLFSFLLERETRSRASKKRTNTLHALIGEMQQVKEELMDELSKITNSRR